MSQKLNLTLSHAVSPGAGLTRTISRNRRLINIGILSISLFFHFQFLNRSNTVWTQHKLSFTGSWEIYNIISALFIFVVLRYKLNRDAALIFLISLIGILFAILSSIYADLEFGQPLIFGLIENRRELSFANVLIFYTIISFLKPSFAEIYLALLCVVITQIVFSSANQYLYPGDLLLRDVAMFDQRKLRIASGAEAYYSLALLAVSYYVVSGKLKYMLPTICLSVIAIVFIDQSKSALLAIMLCVCVGIAFRHRFVGLWFIAGIAGFAFIIILFGADLSNQLVHLFSTLAPALKIDELITSGDPIRIDTIDKVIRSLSNNYYFGLGGLSQQWNNGFAPIYGKHFFLTDVGVFGEIYQVGLLYPIFFVSILFFILYLAITARSIEGLVFVILACLMIGINLGTVGIFMRGGTVISFMYLISRSEGNQFMP